MLLICYLTLNLLNYQIINLNNYSVVFYWITWKYYYGNLWISLFYGNTYAN